MLSVAIFVSSTSFKIMSKTTSLNSTKDLILKYNSLRFTKKKNHESFTAALHTLCTSNNGLLM